jgi:hypothetical protein
MKRGYLTVVASLFLFWFFALAPSVPSFADDKKEVAKDVKFACSQHGPADMTLTLSLETGDPRRIEFIGGTDTTKWVVKIDGQFAQAGKGGTNGDTVKVRSGDSITWSFAAKKHGVAFAEKALAEALLDFDPVFKPLLVDQKTKLTTNAWKMFGADLWGTDPTTDFGIFAACKVK